MKSRFQLLQVVTFAPKSKSTDEATLNIKATRFWESRFNIEKLSSKLYTQRKDSYAEIMSFLRTN